MANEILSTKVGLTDLSTGVAAPAASYGYVVGAGGAGGAAGTNGFDGGAGGAGLVLVTEHYQ